jgi:hypothetical protein
VKLTQETNYPWDGKVTVKVEPASVSEFTDPSAASRAGARNPKCTSAAKRRRASNERGYVAFKRQVDLRRHDHARTADARAAHGERSADQGERSGDWRWHAGRWCTVSEATDNGGSAPSLKISRDEEFMTEHRDHVLGGVTMIKGKSLTAIPYYAWDNREPGAMARLDSGMITST